MKRLERNWMYERLDSNKKLRKEFVIGVNKFIDYVKQQDEFIRNKEIRFPCSKCKNKKFLVEQEVRKHLGLKGFCDNYYDWVCHGEKFPVEEEEMAMPSDNPYRDMVEDALRDSIDQIREEALNAEVVDESQNPNVLAFFQMLKRAEQPVYEGCRLSLLQSAARLVALKCEHNLAHKCVDGFTSLMGDLLPQDHILMRNFYETKNVLKALQLPHEKIDACFNGCMLFWMDDALLDKCRKCGRARYKSAKNANGKRVPENFLNYFPIGPRLQRIYATKNLAEQMRWHYENPRVSGTMSHPSDSEAWKHFDHLHPSFASEPRNVRLGLCTDGFSAFGPFGNTYSCWPVMLTPYNLPPWLCMKRQFMFLTLIIPGPKSPKQNLDVYLQPLIHELKQLWDTGLFTYDVSRKQNFDLRVALLWTINDFPAYGMLSGWSTAGENACPCCTKKETKSTWLQHSRKWSWFDCHRQYLDTDHTFRKDKVHFRKGRIENDVAGTRLSGEQVWECVKDLPKIVDASDHELKTVKAKRIGWWKQSIFWELPYWSTLLIRHNLDVMHIEKIFFEQLIHTVMDRKDKTTLNPTAQKDILQLCSRSRKVDSVVLKKEQKKVLCDWICNLKFPDGYASDLRRCVDMNELKLHGLKSHDCHVFMERLLPVALRHLLPKNEWNAITEISQFFRDLCTSSVQIEKITSLEKNIVEIICKLEKILPPSFFNSMEHLPIHLPYEVKVGGPVQYRWMYPFERFLNHLKKKIGNKARVQGSLCNAYLLEEIANFCSFYFEDHIDTKAKDLDIGQKKAKYSTLPELFQDHEGTTSGKCRERFLEDNEYERAHLYVLSNCDSDELKRMERLFEDYIKREYPEVSMAEDIWNKFETKFPNWLRGQVNNLKDPVVVALANGPSKKVRTWKRYSINGYKFRAFIDGKDLEKSTINNGVCVSSTEGADYYGTLNEVVELSYTGEKNPYNVILFKCNWIDNSERGMQVHKEYKLVDVNRSKKFPKYDPFVLAYQVEQVCYAPYPNIKRDKDQWSAVFKIKARSQVDAPTDESIFQEDVNNGDTTLTIIEIEDENENVEEEQEETQGDEMQVQNDDMQEEEDEEELGEEALKKYLEEDDDEDFLESLFESNENTNLSDDDDDV